jgi:hypothetical protein
MLSPLVFTLGFLPRAVVSGFFIVLTHPLMLSGNLTAGHKGKPILWGSLEILARVAKIVPLDERLSDMCGSVQHAKV